jgi:hypothetical protein
LGVSSRTPAGGAFGPAPHAQERRRAIANSAPGTAIAARILYVYFDTGKADEIPAKEQYVYIDIPTDAEHRFTCARTNADGVLCTIPDVGHPGVNPLRVVLADRTFHVLCRDEPLDEVGLRALAERDCQEVKPEARGDAQASFRVPATPKVEIVPVEGADHLPDLLVLGRRKARLRAKGTPAGGTFEWRVEGPEGVAKIEGEKGRDAATLLAEGLSKAKGDLKAAVKYSFGKNSAEAKHPLTAWRRTYHGRCAHTLIDGLAGGHVRPDALACRQALAPLPDSLKGLAKQMAERGAGEAAVTVFRRFIGPGQPALPKALLDWASGTPSTTKRFLDAKANEYFADLFAKAAAGPFGERQVSFSLTKYDLYHGHFFVHEAEKSDGGQLCEIGMLIHAKEYPSDGPMHAGEAPFSSADASNPYRNLLWLLSKNQLWALDASGPAELNFGPDDARTPVWEGLLVAPSAFLIDPTDPDAIGKEVGDFTMTDYFDAHVTMEREIQPAALHESAGRYGDDIARALKFKTAADLAFGEVFGDINYLSLDASPRQLFVADFSRSLDRPG